MFLALNDKCTHSLSHCGLSSCPNPYNKHLGLLEKRNVYQPKGLQYHILVLHATCNSCSRPSGHRLLTCIALAFLRISIGKVSLYFRIGNVVLLCVLVFILYSTRMTASVCSGIDKVSLKTRMIVQFSEYHYWYAIYLYISMGMVCLYISIGAASLLGCQYLRSISPCIIQ